MTGSLLNWFNIILGVAAIGFIFELSAHFLGKFRFGIIFDFIKFVFYSTFAAAIHAIAFKTGLSDKDPNNFLTLFTFALSLFEALQNLLQFISGLKNSE